MVRRSYRYRYRRRHQQTDVVQGFALPVWGIDPQRCTAAQLKAYREHFEELLFYGIDQSIIISVNSITSLVNSVRNASRGTIRDIMNAVEAAQPPCLKAGYTDQSVRAAVCFAAKLWLFLDLDIQDDDALLKDVVEQEVGTLVGPSSKLDVLSRDFSEKTLTRKAGMKIVWTSNLTEHLRYEGDSTVYIFRHAQALGLYDAIGQELFPNGFLEEAERTISLLFPPAAIKSERRNTKISEKHLVDIELALPLPPDDLRELSHYKYWQHQLGQLMVAYNEARPKRLKQWYFDRRNRNEWATFWIAVIVFFLTVIFGVIQSVTGIIQVAIAYQSLSS